MRQGQAPSARFAPLYSLKNSKAKTPPAFQGESSLRFRLHSLLPSLLIRSRAALLSVPLRSTAPLTCLRGSGLRVLRRRLRGEFHPGSTVEKGKNTASIFRLAIFAFPRSLFHFSGVSLLLSPGEPELFPVGIMGFPRPCMMFSGSSTFVFLPRSFRFPHACLFVLHHPGRPAYVMDIHAAAWYPLRLARGYAPCTPARPAKGSGQGKSKKRKRS